MASMLSTASRPALRGVVFDLDGTLSVPNLDFGEMYRRCGVSRDVDILEAIAAMPPAEAAKAQAVVDEMEEEGRRTLQLMPGARDLARWLAAHNIPTALVTRNTRATVDHLHAELWGGLPRFEPTIARDDGDLPPKPDPAALESIIGAWGAPPRESVVMVGDSPTNDVLFGKAAGVRTALVDTGRRYGEGGSTEGADIVVDGLHGLAAKLHEAYELPRAGPLKKYPRPEPLTRAAKAAAAGDVEMLRRLSKDQLTAPDDTRNTPLHWAADSGKGEAVAWLIEAGASLDARGFLGATAVCRAARKGHIWALQELLVAGADVDLANDKMQSPLHFAAFKKRPEAVDALLAAGASPFVLDRKGRTPAEDTSDEAIRDMILEAQSEIRSGKPTELI
eukprot:CAMPEP_0119274780 /NCGR_PEP_ID=MMETSP1329-20130426/12678_1 /TAXON_ID=114041 /ORGANISM="Genus nov. species nov., Strain RCC1024" /LENGTH=391 /DNA_ID=CAMNT_0007275127 /DNA_START=211 /DNA_END=1386 /DNA_ORIENTATION=+